MQFLKFITRGFTNRDLVLLSLIALGLVVIVLGLLVFSFSTFTHHGVFIMICGQTLAEWSGLILLVLNGTVIKTKYWKYMVAGACIVLMSALFSILHLPGEQELMVLGLVLIEVTYTVWFIKREPTSVFDWMKYIWTGAWYSATIVIVFLKWSEAWWLVADVLFWITLAMFINIRINQSQLNLQKRSANSLDSTRQFGLAPRAQRRN